MRVNARRWAAYCEQRRDDWAYAPILNEHFQSSLASSRVLNRLHSVANLHLLGEHTYSHSVPQVAETYAALTTYARDSVRSLFRLNHPEAKFADVAARNEAFEITNEIAHRYGLKAFRTRAENDRDPQPYRIKLIGSPPAQCARFADGRWLEDLAHHMFIREAERGWEAHLAVGYTIPKDVNSSALPDVVEGWLMSDFDVVAWNSRTGFLVFVEAKAGRQDIIAARPELTKVVDHLLRLHAWGEVNVPSAWRVKLVLLRPSLKPAALSHLQGSLDALDGGERVEVVDLRGLKNLIRDLSLTEVGS